MTIDDVARSFTKLDASRPGQFDELAETVFAFQRARNPVYSRYCKVSSPAGYRDPAAYLPIAAFKRTAVAAFAAEDAAHIFESSGTGAKPPSRHYVKDLSIYDRSAEAHFERVFGKGPFVLATHLPHYEQMGRRSSLLYMIERLIGRFGAEGSGSFLSDPQKLTRQIQVSRERQLPLIVFGAAFGLLDFIETHPCNLPEYAIVVETGGMKTYRQEISRPDLHRVLAAGFRLPEERIWSEYGMCELLSQCYTRGGPVFHPPPWMRFQVLDPEDPTGEVDLGESGALALFDLANIHTVSAILTEDRAVRREGGFEVIGRLSGAELRGCNFLLEGV